MYINKSTRTRIFSMVGIYLLAGIANLLEYYVPTFPVRLSAFAQLCYFAICIVAMVYVERNLINKTGRRLAMVVIMVALFWQAIRLFEISAAPLNSHLDRHFWYAYYFPMTFIPTLIFLSVLNSGLHSGDKISSKWYLLLIIPLALSLGVQTNDLHFLAFTFPYGLDNFNYGYHVGPIYIMSMTWVFVMIFAVGVLLHKNNSLQRIRKYRWVIYAFGILIIIYLVWWFLWLYKVIDGGPLRVMFWDPEIWLGFILVGMELAIRLGFIRSNFNYDEMYMDSTIPTAIYDNNMNLIYRSSVNTDITDEQREEAVGGPVYVDENRRLHGQRISGGYSYWIEDLSTINSSAKELSLVKEMLQQDNDLIKAENDMLARQTKTEEQMKLYDMLSQNVEPQLKKVESLIHAVEPNDPQFKENLKKACVYKAYVKRLSNLILLNNQSEVLNAFELESSMRESMEYLKLNGVACNYSSHGTGEYPGERLIMAYGIFQQILEDNLNQASRVMVNLDVEDDRINMGILASSKGDTFEKEKHLEEFKSQLEDMGGSLIYNGGESMYIDIEIPNEEVMAHD